MVHVLLVGGNKTNQKVLWWVYYKWESAWLIRILSCLSSCQCDLLGIDCVGGDHNLFTVWNVTCVSEMMNTWGLGHPHFRTAAEMSEKKTVIFWIKSIDSTGDRTQNLWFRRPAPYPLGHGVVFVSIPVEKLYVFLCLGWSRPPIYVLCIRPI